MDQATQNRIGYRLGIDPILPAPNLGLKFVQTHDGLPFPYRRGRP